jgi:hypothetical protein
MHDAKLKVQILVSLYIGVDLISILVKRQTNFPYTQNIWAVDKIGWFGASYIYQSSQTSFCNVSSRVVVYLVNYQVGLYIFH